MLPRPPIPTLFPYTTLFRSDRSESGRAQRFAFALAEPLRGADRAQLEPGTAEPGRGWSADVGEPPGAAGTEAGQPRSEEHTSELQSRQYLVCRLLLEKKKKK